jgi:hypothetical protein
MTLDFLTKITPKKDLYLNKQQQCKTKPTQLAKKNITVTHKQHNFQE